MFLTYLPRKNLISLNLLLIDTYHDIPAFKNYKSIQKWKYDLKKDRDIVKKAIAYSSVGGSEQKVKILTQFTDHFTIQSQVEQDNDYAEVNTHQEFEHAREDEDSSDYMKQLSQAPFIIDKEKGNIFYV